MVRMWSAVRFRSRALFFPEKGNRAFKAAAAPRRPVRNSLPFEDIFW